MQRLGDIQAWCKRVAARLEGSPFEDKGLALDALTVQATVYRSDHSPRWVITAAVSLQPEGTAATPQTGQDSILYDASQNIHS